MPFNLKKANWKKFKQVLREELIPIEEALEIGENLFFNNSYNSPTNISFLQQIEELSIEGEDRETFLRQEEIAKKIYYLEILVENFSNYIKKAAKILILKLKLYERSKL